MTARQTALALIALVLAAALAASVTLSRLNSAAQHSLAAARAASRVERDAARLESLRAGRPSIGQGSEPQADALALVNAALDDAALPAAHLRSLMPDAQPVASAEPGTSTPPGYQRRTLRLTLGGLALPNLGAFLESWRTTQGVWTITHVSLRREPSPRPTDPDRWTAAMTLSATYLADPPSGATP